MYNKITEVRLTSYALISSLEQDLRELIITNIIPHYNDISFLNDSTLIEDVTKRFLKDNPGLNPNKNSRYVIDFLDFQDAYKVILACKQVVNQALVMQLRQIVPILDTLVPIRNRIMHSRPLLTGDFSNIFNFCSTLIPSKDLPWSNTTETMDKLTKDPSFVFSVSIPVSNCSDNIPHNLPMPDFDDTGFIGREEDAKNLMDLILGNTNVVSLIGDGGIGKTALMLKVAYDLVDLKVECPFDTILWYSSKTTMLTASGIQELHNNLVSTSYFVSNIASEIGAPAGKKTSDNIKEILDFMDNFKVLLILDNLETVYEEGMRDFIKSASLRSKIAITSRIGLGELEYRRLLKGLTEKEAASLMRNMSKMRNNDLLLKLSNKQLADIGTQLHFNPLALKWFVNSVELGNTPQNVLQKKDDLLSFCLSNVYGKLSVDSKLVLDTILAARKPLNDAELAFLSELDPLKLRQSLNQLFSTTLLCKEVNSKTIIPELSYNVTPFAKEYLLMKHSPNRSFVKSIVSKMKKLSGTFEEVTRITDINEFDVNAIQIRNNNEKVAARYLQEALYFSRPNNHLYEQALQRVKAAKSLAPSYFEVYRISAFIKACNNDLLGAEEDYKLALEIEPDNPRTLYFYAGFLSSEMQDTASAKEFAEKALELRPDSSQVSILYARCQGYSGDYENAIKTLSEALFHSSNISSKYLKISSTLLIDFYRRWAEDERNIKKDLTSAINKLKAGFEIFDNAILKNVTDKRMSSELAELLITYTYTINLLKNNAEEKAIEKYWTYKNFFKCTAYSKKLSDMFGQKENDPEIADLELEYNGVVIEYTIGNYYAFIKTANLGNVYLNRQNFRNIDDWRNIKNGVTVNFKAQYAQKGLMAIDVSIVDVT